MTLKLDRSKCNRLSMACLTIAQSLEREAADPATNSDRREIAQRSAEMWYHLRDEIRTQIDAFDKKQAEKKGGAA